MLKNNRIWQVYHNHIWFLSFKLNCLKILIIDYRKGTVTTYPNNDMRYRCYVYMYKITSWCACLSYTYLLWSIDGFTVKEAFCQSLILARFVDLVKSFRWPSIMRVMLLRLWWMDERARNVPIWHAQAQYCYFLQLSKHILFLSWFITTVFDS